MNPQLSKCMDCGIPSMNLTHYQNRAGTNLEMMKVTRTITTPHYTHIYDMHWNWIASKERFVEEVLKVKEIQHERV